jgi:GTP diphosphokinase / guanosine-3',5'-bis(diphosphate) 3'-diphosphatase
MVEKNTVPAAQIKLSGAAFENPQRGIEKMYRGVYLALVAKDATFAKLDRDAQVAKMSYITLAYDLAKALHRDQKRIDGRRYFDHIQGVTEILITEFPTLTFHQVLAAYLHDIVEDTDITLATIENIFGKRVSEIVESVTKKPDTYYLWPDERVLYDSASASEKKSFLKEKKEVITARRTEHYFGHMKDLDVETLQVKFADRIHNLRDLAHCTVKKIKVQLAQTETYMLPAAAKKNPTAFLLMRAECEKLHGIVYGNTEKFERYLVEVLGW